MMPIVIVMQYDTIYQIIISKNNVDLKAKALYDTGCNLRESFSGNPAVIVDKKILIIILIFFFIGQQSLPFFMQPVILPDLMV